MSCIYQLNWQLLPWQEQSGGVFKTHWMYLTYPLKKEHTQIQNSDITVIVITIMALFDNQKGNKFAYKVINEGCSIVNARLSSKTIHIKSVTRPMSSSSNRRSSPCQGKVEGEVLGSRSIRCMCNQLPIQKKIGYPKIIEYKY